MAWVKPLLAVLLVATMASGGCLSSFNGYFSNQGDLTVQMVTAPPHHSQDINASYIDSFSKLTVLVKTFTIRPHDNTEVKTFNPGVVVDLTKLAAVGPEKLFETKIAAKSYDRWGATVYVQDAVLRNGTHVHVDTASGNFYFIEYGVQSATVGHSYGAPVGVPAGGSLTYNFGVAVLKDSGGHFFLRSRGDLSGPAS